MWTKNQTKYNTEKLKNRRIWFKVTIPKEEGSEDVFLTFLFLFFTSTKLCSAEYITPIFTLNDPHKKKKKN